jgi:hypothetical protein
MEGDKLAHKHSLPLGLNLSRKFGKKEAQQNIPQKYAEEAWTKTRCILLLLAIPVHLWTWK